MKKVTVTLLVAMFLFSAVSFLCAEEKTKDEVIAIAVEAAKAKGFEVAEADVIYDEGGKLWNEQVGYLALEDQSPNHGILRKGFLKNYKVILFDFKEPIKDIWVFVDKDTGEVLDVTR